MTAPLLNKHFSQAGFAAILSTMIILTIVVIVVAGLSLVTLLEQKISTNSLRSAQAYYAAESGIEDTLYRLIKGKSYATPNNFAVASSSVALTISGTSSQKTILAEGQASARWRNLQVVLNTGGQSTTFYYGVQVGAGGLIMDNNSRVTGSIYSNSSIQGNNGATITGDAWVANTALTANQQSLTTDSDFIFGQANPNIDPAQSFTPSTSGNLVKVSLYLKKAGSPTNKTVRLLTDDSGQPSKTLVGSGTYGTLTASQVTASYGWQEITLNTPATLTSGTKYWILIDSSLDSDNYFIWGQDSSDSYGGGTGKVSQNWSAGQPTWNSASGDMAFKVWFGSANTFLDNVAVGANAHANTITNSTVTGDAYYQTIQSTTVGGTAHPGSADPAQESLPISQAVVDDWKAQAEAGGIIYGDYTVDAKAAATLGPKKITGNLIVSNQGDLTITGTLYVVGNVNIFNEAKVRLSSGYGANSGVVLNDGQIMVSNGCTFFSPSAGSYLLFITTKSGPAISINNNSDTAIFYAANGSIDISNNVTLKELTGYQIHLNNGAQVIYESGLASILFSSGVSGSWSVASWQEVP